MEEVTHRHKGYRERFVDGQRFLQYFLRFIVLALVYVYHPELSEGFVMGLVSFQHLFEMLYWGVFIKRELLDSLSEPVVSVDEVWVNLERVIKVLGGASALT